MKSTEKSTSLVIYSKADKLQNHLKTRLPKNIFSIFSLSGQRLMSFICINMDPLEAALKSIASIELKLDNEPSKGFFLFKSFDFN